MDDQIFDLLRSPDAEDRKRAIKALARSTDREALRYLATIYKEDPDPEVRNLAVKAGKHIKKQIELSEWGADTGIVVSDEDIAIDIDRSQTRQSQSLPNTPQITEGKALLDKAMEYVVRSDYDAAEQQVYSALQIAPELANDSYYAGIISEVMGMPAREALAKVKATMAEAGGDKGKRKRKRGTGVDAPSWTNVLVTLAIVFVAVVGTQVITDIISVAAMREPIEQFTTLMGDLYAQEQMMDPSMSSMPAADFEQLLLQQFALSSSIGAIIGGRLLSGIFMIIGYMISIGALHLIATMMLGGAGSYRGMLEKAAWPTIAYFVIAAVVQMIFGILIFSGISDAFSTLDLATMTDAEIEMIFGPLISQAFAYGALVFIIYVVWSVWLGFVTGKNYDFGTGKGCLTLFLSYILSGVFACALFFAFGTAIASLFSGM